MSENNTIQPSNPTLPDNQANKKTEPKKNRDVKTIVSIVIAAEIVLAILLGIFLFKSGYTNAKTETSEKIRKGAYDNVYGATEKANHVSNRVTISLEGIKEKADLEVLQVCSSYLYVTDEEDKQDKKTIWYTIPGKGSFTIDMRMAQYITDSERHQVHVIAPSPTITKFEEMPEGIKELFYKDDRFIVNGDVKDGTELAQKMILKARAQMLKDLDLNIAYFQAAEDSAAKLITNIIKALNPSIPDLKVTVEFRKGIAS